VSEIPTYDKFMNPVIQALRVLGGSGTIEEINTKVFELMGLSSIQLEVLHDPEKGGISETEYRLHWTRTYLKKAEVLENSSRGVWALTSKGRQLDKVNPQEVKRYVQNLDRANREVPADPSSADANLEPSWREQTMSYLLEMEPASFERLIQRMLRECGFIQVEVTGRSGDGGIDDKGIMRLGGLMSFHVIFQCKRYQGSVGAGQIRDFRGAMVGRADKGLFVTTGNFTKDAVKEATRDGAPAIDLLDGDQLVDKLKELGLGIQSRKIEIEQITVDQEWFASI
jgi:restriction system protein